MSKEKPKLPWYYKIELPLWLVLIIVGYLLYYILRRQFVMIIGIVFSKIMQIIIEVQIMLFKAKDTLMKAAGVLQGLFLFIVGQVYFLITFINSLFYIARGILIAYTILIAFFFGLGAFFAWWAPMIGFPLLKYGLTLLVSYLGLAIPIMISMVIMAALTAEIERRDNLLCFHPETKIKLANGKFKAMKDSLDPIANAVGNTII